MHLSREPPGHPGAGGGLGPGEGGGPGLGDGGLGGAGPLG